MRARSSSGSLSVQAIAGTHVVTLGFDFRKAEMSGVLGFGVERIDHTEGEHQWLPNRLRFTSVRDRWSSNWNPFQTFTWGDYRAKPDHSYTYRVHALEGVPGKELHARASTAVHVVTESSPVHGVWFNRGVTGAQAYAERFGNKHPERVPNREAWRWLSRGLEEALLEFIGQAIDGSWTLYGAFYEFEYRPILEAFRVASTVGANVELIVFDHPDNRAAVEDVGIDHLVVTWRARARIPHNKFVIVAHDADPVSVWTGSTNITENGIFGQSNVGHTVTDSRIAQQFFDYWSQLLDDPTPGTLNNWVDENNPVPSGRWRRGTSVVFSPHTRTEALDAYANLFASAETLACGTMPFNLDERFAAQLAGDYEALRWLLFEDRKEAARHRDLVTDPDTELVAGEVVPEGALRRWVREMENPFSNNIEFIHTKYLLIDPLSDDPIVVTGSANFSVSSTTRNDENVLVIRGDTGASDVYFSEFFRLWNHHRFRQFLRLRRTARTPGPETNTEARAHLDENDLWWAKYYEQEARVKQRELLAGTA